MPLPLVTILPHPHPVQTLGLSGSQGVLLLCLSVPCAQSPSASFKQTSDFHKLPAPSSVLVDKVYSANLKPRQHKAKILEQRKECQVTLLRN